MADGSGFTGFEPLRRSISGELFDDGFTRGRYATDASIYQMLESVIAARHVLRTLSLRVERQEHRGER